MTDAQLQWKEPAGRQQAGVAAKLADQLRANPGEWAIIEEYPVPVYPANPTEEQKDEVRAESKKVRAKASSRASLIKQGRVAAYKPQGSFNAVSRSEDVGDQRVIRVYAVYSGDGEGVAAAEDNS
ncbi:MAG: hypothetical protein WC054_00585 [Candidatus Nanopelagicales bacterium]